MQITGIEWVDTVIMLVLASGALGLLWKFMLSHSRVQQAVEKHEWLKMLEPVLGAAINKAEAWGRADSSRNGVDKLDHATNLVITGMDVLGLPARFKNEELIHAMIESKLAGGDLSDVAAGVLSKMANNR